MLSTEYRKRLEFICSRIAEKQEVLLEDMIWAEKLAKQIVRQLRSYVVPCIYPVIRR